GAQPLAFHAEELRDTHARAALAGVAHPRGGSVRAPGRAWGRTRLDEGAADDRAHVRDPWHRSARRTEPATGPGWLSPRRRSPAGSCGSRRRTSGCIRQIAVRPVADGLLATRRPVAALKT